MKIKVAKDFSTCPGPRYENEGKYSGQVFRRDLLVDKIKKSVALNSTLMVDLDGVSGYGTSFLEEAFGGLIREEGFRLATLQPVLQFISEEEPDLIKEIREYLADAEDIASEQEKKKL